MNSQMNTVLKVLSDGELSESISVSLGENSQSRSQMDARLALTASSRKFRRERTWGGKRKRKRMTQASVTWHAQGGWKYGQWFKLTPIATSAGRQPGKQSVYYSGSHLRIPPAASLSPFIAWIYIGSRGSPRGDRNSLKLGDPRLRNPERRSFFLPSFLAYFLRNEGMFVRKRKRKRQERKKKNTPFVEAKVESQKS